MSMFNEDSKTQLSTILQEMVNPVKIVCFFGSGEKNEEARQFVTEFSEFSDKISLVIHSDADKSLMIDTWNAHASPAIFVSNSDESLKGVGYLGTPGGYEINSFLMSILEVSGKVEALSSAHKQVVDSISHDIEIYTFISLTCPQCPQAVMNIHRLAIENRHIKAYMVEGPAFKDYTELQGIQAFPTIKIGDKSLVGQNAKDMNQLIELLK